MLEQLKKEWKIQRGDIYGLVGGTCGAFVFGMVLVFIILKLDDDPNKTYFCMGTLMAVVGAAVIMLVMRGVTYPMSLQVAISMGRTRREYIFAYLVMSVLLAAVCVAVVWALYAFESWLYPMLYPMLELDSDMHMFFDIVFSPKFVVPFIVGLAVVSFFVGAVIARYGKGGMVVAYITWMASVILLPRIVDAVGDSPESALGRFGTSMGNLITTVPAPVWAAIGAGVAVILLVIGIRISLRQRVNI